MLAFQSFNYIVGAIQKKLAWFVIIWMS